MRISSAEEREFLEGVFTAYSFSNEDSALLADTLVDADLRGIASHGIQRLAWYIRMIKEGTIQPQNKVKVLKETPTSLLVDANKNMGQIASAFAMKNLIKKTKQVGLSMAVIRNSNHFGTAGYYSRMAVAEGLIGIATTNTRPLVAPTNATQAFLGSNAFAFTFPASPHPFVFDGATSVVSGGKIQVLAKNNKPLPGDWAIDGERNVIHDAQAAEDILAKVAFTEHQTGGGVLTLGGNSEKNSNYKGFGNSLIIELLTGILAQGSISADTNTGEHDFSQFFLTLDPAVFGDLETFATNATAMFTRIRGLEHTPGTQIMIPGDREYKNYHENLQQGVLLDEKSAAEIKEIAQELEITVPKFK
ncbi:Ldh family oxidoreductase [Liquorilactobacillus satsumensis]|uniref:Malate L-lactate dehydrogenase n=1 Tax=Liquorilactobacillus satsumensis DSM 16230 = JCM 12392 TaxID=1423801 RepID=A0A0R1V458_9LACO|nr:Ldh family oxidoreductase [Liquorilactobacillus satsumensis]KRM00321.1 malate L-lactate dehydrogenase [Liquorilactobacillus satsumensis DSM 16230 = JCM 12392]MCC7667718.1 malate dehydrogenase [Liquorilactobacillus satsumensis]MCP9313658.1 Ldh family oxidoreductase [Liquorilactobacillus satsumensis]MCP9328980.1 Ldh family oxidoreductase [Liquorilactobacillus satsumensis]MCP9357690.1 Ldh family oxidoreductase [Liquorilactobacillus satsumensis]